MKKIIALILTLILAFTCVAALSSCGEKYVIAIPNDTTNEARALLLLEANGLIEVDDAAGITATVRDITSNPYKIKFKEVEAAQLPRVLQDVDFAVINSNYALEADINPAEDALAIEGSYSAYANILSVKQGNENTDMTKALIAALKSQAVKDFINSEYDGAVVSVVKTPIADGLDTTVNYDALSGQSVTIAASPTPHAEILEIVKTILENKGITVVIQEFTDYVLPNTAVESGECYANFFQHVPYMDDFNVQNGTHIVSAVAVHVEPMGIYSNKFTSLDDLKQAK